MAGMTVVPLLAMTEILLIVLTSSTREGQVCHTTHHDYDALLEVSSRTDMAPKDVPKLLNRESKSDSLPSSTRRTVIQDSDMLAVMKGGKD